MDEVTPYVFQEYPKWVSVDGSEPVLCETKEEEDALTSVRSRRKSQE